MAGAELDASWNDDAGQQVREAFVATGMSYAETNAKKVLLWLDEQARAWKEARTELCLNAEVRGGGMRTWWTAHYGASRTDRWS